MRCKALILLAITALVGLPPQAMADINLGTAGNFAVLAGSTVTNTGNTVINGGDVGLSPGSSVTGFGPGIIVAPYTMHVADAVAGQAQTDLTTAYNQAAGLAPTMTTLTYSDLGGHTLTPGVYAFTTSEIGLTGALTLNDLGNPNAQFVFQIGDTLITASNSSVVTINSGSSTTPGCDVFWQVASSATLGTYSTFEGHILAHTSISMNTGANIVNGSALASTGAVTLQDNSITNCETAAAAAAAAAPEPSTTTIALLGGALMGLPTFLKRLRARGRLKSSAGSPTNR